MLQPNHLVEKKYRKVEIVDFSSVVGEISPYLEKP